MDEMLLERVCETLLGVNDDGAPCPSPNALISTMLELDGSVKVPHHDAARVRDKGPLRLRDAASEPLFSGVIWSMLANRCIVVDDDDDDDGGEENDASFRADVDGSS